MTAAPRDARGQLDIPRIGGHVALGVAHSPPRAPARCPLVHRSPSTIAYIGISHTRSAVSAARYGFAVDARFRFSARSSEVKTGEEGEKGSGEETGGGTTRREIGERECRVRLSTSRGIIISSLLELRGPPIVRIERRGDYARLRAEGIKCRGGPASAASESSVKFSSVASARDIS